LIPVAKTHSFAVTRPLKALAEAAEADRLETAVMAILGRVPSAPTIWTPLATCP
jgi:hypothetical protein